MKSFRLMSFNVRGAFPEKHPVREWPARADLNVRTIQRAKPDIIGFQEVHSENSRVYTERLTDYDFTVGRSRHSGEWMRFNPIYYRRAVWDLRDAGGFFLSETPEVWSKGWDAAFVRAVTWARLYHREMQAEIVHCNVHLDHVGEESRLKSSALMLQQLDHIAPDVPVIISGDFNSRAWAPPNEEQISYPPAVYKDKLPPGNTVYKVLLDGGFRDTYAEAGHHNLMDMNTFHAFMGESFPPCALRIDWILLRDGTTRRIETERFDIVRDGEPPTYPSDHFPVLAELSLSAS